MNDVRAINYECLECAVSVCGFMWGFGGEQTSFNELGLWLENLLYSINILSLTQYQMDWSVLIISFVVNVEFLINNIK